MWTPCRTGPAGCRRGFSLVEMMIVLVVAGLLLLVTLPAYQGVLRKSYRAAGRGALLDIVARQEHYLINYQRYAADLRALGLPDPYHVDPLLQAVPVDRAVYRLELVFVDDQYTGARAVPVNGQRKDRHCLAFALSREGVRSVSGSAAPDPWQCWR